MPVYIYKAATKDGQIVRNRVEEINKFILLRKLKDNNLSPISVTQINTKLKKNLKKQKMNVETSTSALKQIREQDISNKMTSSQRFWYKLKKKLFSNVNITQKDITIFTQNFYLLKKANFNNIHALTTLIETTENDSLKAIIEDILLGVEAGENMYTTMQYYEGVFSPIYINTIRVGELSGSLTKALEEAVKYLDETAAMNKKLKSIIVPNLAMFIGLAVLLIVGSIVAIPMLQNVLDSVGSKDQLPPATLWFKGVLDRIIAHWYIPTSIIAAIVIAIIIYVKTPQGKYNYHYFKYKMPIFGGLIFAIDFSRLVKAMLLNIKNGMRLQEALETSKSISSNLVMRSIIEASINNILVGQSWIEPFEKAGFSSPMVIEMLKIGMQTDLAEMLEKMVEYMEIDINNIIEKTMKALPNIIYIIVGIMLIFVTVVILAPMIQMYMGGWMFSAFAE